MNVFSEIFGDGGEEEEAGVGLPVSERGVVWMDLRLLGREEGSAGRWQA